MHLTYFDLGRVSYREALDIQERLLREVQAGDGDRAYLLFVEHDPPVITLGRRGTMDNVLVSPERLRASGVEIVESSRGGDVTYHGPGQLVAYPIIRLGREHRTVHGHVRNLEESVLRVLDALGLAGQRRKDFTGVWVGDEKVAAIGVAVRQWVAYHGLALNVSADLSGFDLIVPCGLADAGVTSLSKLTGSEIPMSRAKDLLLKAMCEVFGFDETSRDEWDKWDERQ